jgi:hypothetical protein
MQEYDLRPTAVGHVDDKLRGNGGYKVRLAPGKNNDKRASAMNRFTTTIALVLGLIAVEPAIACSCAVSGATFEEQVADAFATADYVILGEVTKVESIVETDEPAHERRGPIGAHVISPSWSESRGAGRRFPR